MVTVVFAFVLAAAFSYANTYTMNVSYQAQKIEKNIGMLEAENQSLRTAINRLDSLPRVEMLAVTQLGMVRPTPNDMLFVAVGDSGLTAFSGAADPEPTKPAYAVTGSNPEERGLPGGKPSDPGILQAFLNLVVR
jgi:cell division protein FtsL